MYPILMLLGGAGLAAFGFYLCVKRGEAGGNPRFAALACLVFLAYSLFTVIKEGPLGFWVEHTRNFWSIQIWFDLLLFASAALFFIVPRARRVHMNLLLWVPLTIATGSIGLMAMLARLFYLEQRKPELGR